MSILGNRVVRTEDPRFLSGDSTYVADMKYPDAVHAVFVRSLMASAKLGEIETSEAAAAPGVLGVFTAADLQLKRRTPRFPIDESAHRPVLAEGVVRYVGEPIAVVVAETVSQAVDAAELVFVDYEPLTAVVTVNDSLAAAQLVHPAMEGNIAGALPIAPSEIDFSECDVVVEQIVINNRVAGAPIEGRSALADWTGERLLCWSSTQGAGVVLNNIVDLYDVEESDVHVRAVDIGGGFGSKGSPDGEELSLPALSKAVGRPVQWTETRSENMVNMVQGRAQQQTVRIGGTAEGDITHYALHVVQDSGAYVDVGAVLPMLTMMMAPGTYDIPNLQYSSQSVFTNTTPVGAFRGAGRPEAAAAIERSVDLFAAEVRLAPEVVRRKNLLPAFNETHINVFGAAYDCGNFPAALETVLEAAGYDELRAEQERRRDAGERKMLGIGLASYVEITAIDFSGAGVSEYARVEIKPDGSVIAWTGSTPQGQGHETAWAMIVADQLGVPFDAVAVRFGDTDVVPTRNVTGGSRSAQVAGSAMVSASIHLVTSAMEHAAAVLEASIDDMIFDRAAGTFHVAGTPARAVTWAEVAVTAAAPLVGISDFVQQASTFPFGAHCSVVEVDLDTGGVTILRHICVDDCGTIVNPLLADGQVHGGVASGIAQALLEEIIFDSEGTPMTSNFSDYGIISPTELPSFERIPMVTPTPLNPLGAKGIGESGTIGSTPAVQNAVVDAVSHLGIRHIDMPCTSQRVWRAIDAAESASA
ncbi:MAG: xanthine dehydrogenase family protein molybdopterin-binding subunit [Acidimicrobiales bacterium]|jgi:carbon-monoxide dehydrogenase large subunit